MSHAKAADGKKPPHLDGVDYNDDQLGEDPILVAKAKSPLRGDQAKWFQQISFT
jgi:hypothetical protein